MSAEWGDTSLSGSREAERGTQGATVPIEPFVSRQLSCFSAANRGYNGGGVPPPPQSPQDPRSRKERKKRRSEGEEEEEEEGLSILELSEPEWGESAFP